MPLVAAMLMGRSGLCLEMAGACYDSAVLLEGGASSITLLGNTFFCFVFFLFPSSLLYEQGLGLIVQRKGADSQPGSSVYNYYYILCNFIFLMLCSIVVPIPR